MKVKKFIGQSVNGFTILDTYAVELPSGSTTRRVLLRCEECGREFERSSGSDFSSIKCKCKCEYLKPKKEKIHWIEYGGKKYSETDFCKMHGVNIGTFWNRVNRGMTVSEAVLSEFRCTCRTCGRAFESNRPNKKYCSKTCFNRWSKGRRELPQPFLCECIICKNLFCTTEIKAKTCSKECRMARDRIERSGRYKKIKARGEFDSTVTLRNVFEKYGGICCACGKEMSFDCETISNDYPSIDHKTPISKGGAHTWDNVQLLCRLCNSKKGARIA